MRLRGFVLATLLVSAPASAQTSRQSAAGGFSGTVVRSSDGQPLPNAQVVALKIDGGLGPEGSGDRNARNSQVMTDGAGQFQITGLTPGTYRLVALRNGFARQEFGQRSFGGSGTVLSVRQGQAVDGIVFRLAAAGAISGRVVQSSGEPAPGVKVQAFRSRYDPAGRRVLDAAGEAQTNDIGEYRIYWLNPGRYVLLASPPSGDAAMAALALLDSSIRSQGEGGGRRRSSGSPVVSNAVIDTSLAPTYYPGTPDPGKAVVVDLPGGADQRGVDFVLNRDYRARISGRVMGASGQPPQSVQFSVLPRGAAGASSMRATLIPSMESPATNYNPEDGTFEIQDLTSGSYLLQVQASADNGADGQLNARVPIEVAGADVANLIVGLRPSVSVRGRIRVEGPADLNANAAERLGIGLEPLSTSGQAQHPLLASAAADGTFMLPLIAVGEYRVVVRNMEPDMYVREARIDGMDALRGVTILDREPTLEIIVGRDAGDLQAVVQDRSGRPLPGVEVVLIPDQNRDRTDLYRTAVTGPDGRIELRGIAPGDYRVFAWEDLEPFAYFDPEFVMQYESQGRRVRIAAGLSGDPVEVASIPAP